MAFREAIDTDFTAYLIHRGYYDRFPAAVRVPAQKVAKEWYFDVITSELYYKFLPKKKRRN